MVSDCPVQERRAGFSSTSLPACLPHAAPHPTALSLLPPQPVSFCVDPPVLCSLCLVNSSKTAVLSSDTASSRKPS